MVRIVPIDCHMNNSNTGVVLVKCSDRPGIIANTTSFFSSHNVNIVSSEQYVDDLTKTFFQRIVFEIKSKEHFLFLEKKFAGCAANLAANYSFHNISHQKRVAILASQNTHCAASVLQSWRYGHLNMHPVLLLGDHMELEQLSSWYELPHIYLPVNKNSREKQEHLLQQTLEEHGVDLVVLARYMRILPSWFCKYWENRCINVHHSFLPAFIGKNPYEEAHERGVKMIGATAHYVVAELDAGPIITQRTRSVTHRDTPSTLAAKGSELESGVLIEALQGHLNASLMVHNNRVVVFS